MKPQGKVRLDQLMTERGLTESREKARRVIMAGLVRVEGQPAPKAGQTIPRNAKIEIMGSQNPYVSRGGLKLAAALERFGVDPAALALALDVGASTGGFTDCLLKHGCPRVVAVDTGRGQIHERLRRHPRLKLYENTNARHMTLDQIGGVPPDLAVIDVSFISLKLILPAVMAVLTEAGRCIALVKPQFEAGRGQVGTGGIVRDPAVHESVLRGVIDFCAESHWPVGALIPSPILGGEGNKEFLLLIEKQGAPTKPTDELIVSALAEEIEPASTPPEPDNLESSS